MPATLRKLDNEPILIVTHVGFLDVMAVEVATELVARALAESDVPLYGIIDLRGVTTDMPNLMRILVHQSSGGRGTLSGDGNRVVLVGGHPFIRIFRKLFLRKPFAGLFIPVFSTLDDALAAQRARIREEARR